MAASTDDFSCRRDRTAAVSGAFAAAGYRRMQYIYGYGISLPFCSLSPPEGAKFFKKNDEVDNGLPTAQSVVLPCSFVKPFLRKSFRRI